MDESSEEIIKDENQLNLNESLNDFLEEDVRLSEIPDLQEQLNYSEIHIALSKLFSGSPDRIALKLFMLNEFFNSETQVWKIAQVHQRFSFIKESHRMSLLLNFRSANLIYYDDYHATYELTDFAYKIQSLITNLQNVQEDDSIGLIATSLQQTVNLDKDPKPQIQFLTKKLKSTIQDFERAIELRAEDELRKGLEQLDDIHKFYDQATESLTAITDDSHENFNRDVHELAQELADVQSSFSYLATRMESTLNQIERHKVSLSTLGHDLDELKYSLKQKSLDQLADFMVPFLRKTVKPLFLTEQFMDEAAEELFYNDHTTEDEIVEEFHDIDEASSETINEEKLDHCIQFASLISHQKMSADFKSLVTNTSWEEACYRLSMLSMLEGTSSEYEADDPISEFRKLPFKIEQDNENEELFEDHDTTIYTRDELRNTAFRVLSKGRIKRQEIK